MTWVQRAFAAVSAALTPRGKGFMAAAAAVALGSAVFGAPQLLRVAVLLVALPLMSAVLLTRGGATLAVARTVTPHRVTADEPVRVRLTVTNTGRLRTGLLLLQDEVVFARDTSPRCLLDGLPAGGSASVTYPVRASHRGRYAIGPLRVGVTDPFGMCRIPRVVEGTDTLVVVPRVTPLASISGSGRGTAGGEGAIRTSSSSGEEDVAVREYRHGDDLRRVHWRSTARRGDLMVRMDEQPRRLRATVLLDVRSDSHHGRGAASSFEWAVTAAASVGVHLMQQRFGVRLLTDDRPAPWSDPTAADAGAELLDRLAVIGTGSTHDLARALAVLDAGGDGLTVAVLGDLTEADARAVARSRRSSGQGIAILLGTGEQSTSLSPRARAQLSTARRRAATMLRAAGWRVVETQIDASIATVWAGVGARPTIASTASGRTPSGPTMTGGPHPSQEPTVNGGRA